MTYKDKGSYELQDTKMNLSELSIFASINATTDSVSGFLSIDTESFFHRHGIYTQESHAYTRSPLLPVSIDSSALS